MKRFPLVAPFQFISVLVVSLLLIIFSNTTTSSAQCLDHQKSSLLTLFGSSAQEAPLIISSWTPSTDCCLWKGVTCDGSGRVTGLDLTNCSIWSPINSTSLISLSSSLRKLNLSLNFFDSLFPVSLITSLSSKVTHLNLSNSGFEGQVPVEISRLKSLESLDLSNNPLSFPSPDFGYVVGNLSGLRELYLDGLNISSPVLGSLAGLRNLTSLHLRSCNLIGEFPVKVFQLRNLKNLDLSRNLRLTGTLPNSFGNLRYLQMLKLKGCNFTGRIPSSLSEKYSRLSHLDMSLNGFGGEIPSLENLHKLVYLDLSTNMLNGEIPPLENLNKLVYLDLSENMLNGEIPSLENLNKLVYLGLSENMLIGEIPPLENLTQLVHLYLWANKLSGGVPSLTSLKNVEMIDLSYNNLSGAIDSSCGQGLLSLKWLYLSHNSLNGKIPSSLFALPSVQSLVLNENQFDGPLDEHRYASSSLYEINLSNNKLQGPIPSSFFQLTGLGVLSLSTNNFNGTLNLSRLHNFKKLLTLDLSNNILTVNTIGTNASFPRIWRLHLRSCNVKEFPHFLLNQSALYYLDLSNNKIDGEIPSWIGSMANWSLSYLNLSHNMLHSLEQPIIDFSSSNLLDLDIHSNKLQGSMPIPPRSIRTLDYSHNYFTSVIPANISKYLDFIRTFSLSQNNISGEIPSSICQASILELLDLSDNSLSGSIPPCLGAMNNLRVLSLKKNNLKGLIPQTFEYGCRLESLNLNRNRLEGPLPKSLAYCKQLEVLNVGNNQINDSFPSWLDSLQHLQVLVLRSNMFHGPIQQLEDRNGFLKMLRIIDISSNDFTGSLPSWLFQSLKGMMVDEREYNQSLRFLFGGTSGIYYQETVTITLKGSETEFLKMLYVSTTVDLSNNRFQGSISEEIGNLKSLQGLNMSHNEFTGPIRSLKQVESLDLSSNRLSGEIPAELTALTFLAVLNLSQNHLIGRIPQGQQFNAFPSDYFQGNPGLCGPQIFRRCESDQAPPESPRANLQSGKEFDWKFIWIGLGFGTGNWLVLGPLIFWTRWRRWYYNRVDNILLDLLVWWDIYIIMPMTR